VSAARCSFVAHKVERLAMVTIQSESGMATSLTACDGARNLA
jgi:hypothetical protein